MAFRLNQKLYPYLNNIQNSNIVDMKKNTLYALIYRYVLCRINKATIK